MTDNELRAAVERVHKGAKNPLYYAFPLQPHGQAKADAVLIVDAYLAEHPADDAEAVTEDWFAAVGIPRGCFDPVCYGWLYGEKAYTLSVNRAPRGSVSGVEVYTRGDVRRLLAALGIAPGVGG